MPIKVQKIRYVQGLEDFPDAEQARAGGKAGTLARLCQAGYPVPDGFVILPTAFSGDELKAEAWSQVQTYVAYMRARPPASSQGHASADVRFSLAVRSSALAEDSARASFAGEFETVLDVCTDEAIREAVHTVRRSRHSERVQAYAQAQGAPPDQEMAVIVQHLVPADLSGVLFTADPISGSQAYMTGNYVPGLGDKLVSGETQPLVFKISRPKGVYDGPPEMEGHADILFKMARRLERELGCPQDIEWATAGDQLWLLQSRPITTLQGRNPFTGEFNDSLTGDYLWSNVNFGEAVAEVMTPLSWSVLEVTLEEWRVLPGHLPAGNIGGLPYLNLSTSATVFRALGLSEQKLLETLEGTVYSRLPEEMEIPLIPLSRRAMLSILPLALRFEIKQRQAVRKLPRYLEANPGWCQGMRRKIRRATSGVQLVPLWRDEIEPHLRYSVWPVLGSASRAANHTTALHRELTELVGSDDADALTSSLSEGSDLLESLGPLVGLARVARGEMEREAYLARYGHRGAEEFELSVPRPAEEPGWLDRQLALLADGPTNVEGLLAQRRAEFDAAWDRLRSAHPRKAKALQRRIRQVAPRARQREAVRSEYARDRWVVRDWALRAGELAGLGEEIFFLDVPEALAVLSGDREAITHIPARRQTYERYKALPPYPPIIRGRFDPFRWAADPERRTDWFDAQVPHSSLELGRLGLISGCPASAGRVEGIVRRLDRLEDGGLFQSGEILVTAQTNIGWTFLFPRAAAIVTNVGAPLSHAAIVARELGIPAVVGCGEATMHLRTGDRVRVDGAQGIVEVLATSQAPRQKPPGTQPQKENGRESARQR